MRLLSPPASTAPTLTPRFISVILAPTSLLRARAKMSRELIEIEEARRLVLERVAPAPGERVALDEALGRVLAEPVRSADDVPGFDNSAMDGYAVAAADTTGASPSSPVRLAVVDESRAGAPAGGRRRGRRGDQDLDRGDAAGGRRRGRPGRGHRRRAARRSRSAPGSSPGATSAAPARTSAPARRCSAAGSDLGPAELGVLASVGVGEIGCARRPRVTVLTTGDELQEPGEPLRPGAIRNSNTHSLAALVRRSGAELAGAEIVRDDPEQTRAALASSARGRRDGRLRRSLGRRARPCPPGARRARRRAGLLGRRAAPGQADVLRGRRRRGCLVFGLPGNPVSAMVTFVLFVRPAIRSLLGAVDEPRRTTALLDREYPTLPARTQAVRCRLALRDDGWHVEPTKEQGSHVLTSMLGADVLAIVPPGEPAPARGRAGRRRIAALAPYDGLDAGRGPPLRRLSRARRPRDALARARRGGHGRRRAGGCGAGARAERDPCRGCPSAPP